MDKLSYKLIVATLIFASLFTPNCSSLEEGCTDPDSPDYSVTAEVDDGSCTYEGAVVFWYDEATSAEIIYYGVTGLTYYVDGELIGSSAANVYWTGPPECGQTGSTGVDKYLGRSKTRKYSYEVLDQTGFDVWSGSITFEANTCIKLHLRGSEAKKK
jgi:hypothetical protein